MEYTGIFPHSTAFPLPILVFFILIFSILLYLSIYRYFTQKLIQKLYSLTSDFAVMSRTLVYCFLVSFPSILLAVSGLIYNNSFIGVQISCNIDEIHLFLVSGYICWIQQSRQTPLRGFILLRDVILVVGGYCVMAYIYFQGKFSSKNGIILLSIFIISYLLQIFHSHIEILRNTVFKLKQSKKMNSKNLLTQSNYQSVNYLQILIATETNKEQINECLKQFQNMLSSKIIDEQQKRIVFNFAKIFLTILQSQKIQKKLFYQRQQIKSLNDWDLGSISDEEEALDQKQQQQKEEESQVPIEGLQEKSNSSANGIMLQRTMTITDFVVETEKKQEQLSIIQKIVKYSCYPIYLLSLSEGRIKNVAYFISIFILAGCMFLISNSTYYFISFTNYNISLSSLLIATFLVYPSAVYFHKISAENDFDFINIFLQSSILKIFIFGLCILLLSVFGSSQPEYGIQNMLIMSLRSFNYILFTLLLFSQKLATRYTNFNFYIAMFAISQLLRIIFEIAFTQTSH